MRILVTGRNGQVARCIAERCVGHELVFTERPGLDLENFASIERTVARVSPDLVISAAAYTAVEAAEVDRALAIRVNGEAPGVLAAAAARCGALIVHLSTDYVFDGRVGRPYREDDTVAPLSVYAESKLAGEAAVATSGAMYAIIRTAWVYSPFGNNFVKTLLGRARNCDTIDVVSDQIGCPTSGFDLAEALLAVADARQHWTNSANGIYHCAGAGEASRSSFAEAVFTESRSQGGHFASVSRITTAKRGDLAQRPTDTRLDCAKFVRSFDYSLKDWRLGLAEVIGQLVKP